MPSSSSILEEQVLTLSRRVGRLEEKVRTPKKAAWHADLVETLCQLQLDSFLRVAGWFLMTVSALAIAVSLVQGESLQPLLGAVLAVGIWLVARDSELFGVSDSTRQLLQESRAGRTVHASRAHTSRQQVRDTLFGVDRLQGTLLGLAMGMVMIAAALAYSWSIFLRVADPAWQLGAFLIFPVAILAYAITAGRRGLVYLATVIIAILLLSAEVPVLAMLALVALSILVGYYAVRTEDWPLFLAVVLSAYLSLLHWVGIFGVQTVAEQQDGYIMASEALLVLNVFFLVPFVFRRRKAEEREVVRFIIGTNAVGFTLLSSWLAFQLSPDGGWLLPYQATLLVTVIVSLLAWGRHGRFSYAKYFSAATLISMLIGSVVYLEPIVTTLMWLMAAIVVVTTGFIASSYSARLLGLFILVGAFLHYLFSALPWGITSSEPYFWVDEAWLGVMLAGFLAVTARWFGGLKTTGPEEEHRRLVSVLLYVMGVLTLVSLAAVAITSGS